MEDKTVLGPISWSSITPEYEEKENGVVNLDGALKIVDHYMSNYEHSEYDWENEFSFRRSKYEYILICVRGTYRISYMFGYTEPNGPWFTKLFRGYDYAKELNSKEELVEKVTNFFTKTPQEIKEGYLRGD
jgi:hypothetical protein